MPAGTAAFYFYAEPDNFATFTITATSGTTVVATPVAGASGANYFGFYGTAGDTIASIAVAITGTTSFAVGEFGISRVTVPDGGMTVSFLGAAILGLIALRRRLA